MGYGRNSVFFLLSFSNYININIGTAMLCKDYNINHLSHISMQMLSVSKLSVAALLRQILDRFMRISFRLMNVNNERHVKHMISFHFHFCANNPANLVDFSHNILCTPNIRDFSNESDYVWFICKLAHGILWRCRTIRNFVFIL